MIKRSISSSAKDIDGNDALHLMVNANKTMMCPPSPSPLPDKWTGGSNSRRRRKDHPPDQFSDFLFQRRREFSLCLICFSLVCIIIGTVLRNHYYASSPADDENSSSFLEGASSTLNEAKSKAKSAAAAVIASKPENEKGGAQAGKELPKSLLRERARIRQDVTDKQVVNEAGTADRNEDHQHSKVESKRFIMEMGGLVDGVTFGRVIIETRPDWAPLGAAHFHELVADSFYDQCRFFRVLPNFVVQFGIAADPNMQAKWREKNRRDPLMDDPVKRSNQRGTVTFATSGKNTRNTQIFINKGDNAYLDQEGFAPFAQVVEGMEFIDHINPQYREKPKQHKIQQLGNDYLNLQFPDLSFVMRLREYHEPFKMKSLPNKS